MASQYVLRVFLPTVRFTVSIVILSKVRHCDASLERQDAAGGNVDLNDRKK